MEQLVRAFASRESGCCGRIVKADYDVRWRRRTEVIQEEMSAFLAFVTRNHQESASPESGVRYSTIFRSLRCVIAIIVEGLAIPQSHQMSQSLR